MITFDDKANIPVGESGKPQATGRRGRNHSCAPVSGPILSALDHDFHWAGVIPFVAFVLDIPSSPLDSFINGNVSVTSKQKMFEPSSPFRHGAELLCNLENNLYNQGEHREKVLLLSLDGGSDYRSTYG